MDVRDELRSLSRDAPRSAPGDGIDVFRRGRRRRVRRHAAAGVAGVALVAIAAAIVLPGTVPAGLTIEDRIADQPDGETLVTDVPGGWHEVRVGDAAFGIPGDRLIVELAPGDVLSCLNLVDERLAFIAADGYPREPVECRARGSSVTSVVASTLAGAPEAGARTQPVRIAGVAGSVSEYVGPAGDARGEVVTDRVYRFPMLDLYLHFSAVFHEPELDEAILATLTPLIDTETVDGEIAGDDRRDPPAEDAPAAGREPDVDEVVTDEGEPEPTDEPQASDVPPVGDDASSEDRAQEPAGPVALTLTDVRIGRHDGFDRVVLEVAGEGELGWLITSGSEAYHQGSGEPVEVAGEAVLTVALRGMVMPPGDDAFGADRVGPPADAGAVTEVLVGSIFEGQHELFIGTTQPVEFRVARLGAPQRLVIDLIHP
jgi:hypothetical protein